MLGKGLGEMMLVGTLFQSVVVVIGVLRFQSGINAVPARVADGSRRQSRMVIGVVGAVHL